MFLKDLFICLPITSANIHILYNMSKKTRNIFYFFKDKGIIFDIFFLNICIFQIK